MNKKSIIYDEFLYQRNNLATYYSEKLNYRAVGFYMNLK